MLTYHNLATLNFNIRVIAGDYRAVAVKTYLNSSARKSLEISIFYSSAYRYLDTLIYFSHPQFVIRRKKTKPRSTVLASASVWVCSFA